MKYYNLKKILKKQATYNVIIGERSNGKTYSVLEHGLKNYFAGKGQIAVVRRWQEDIRGKRGSRIFSALIEDGLITKYSKGEFTGVHYWAGRFHPCNYDDNGKAIYNPLDVLGYAFALSDAEHNKSVSFPDITTISFDEFLTNQVYLQDEFTLFMSTLSTIIRQRENVQIFMMGNTVSKYCPYFAEMGLKNILKMDQGDIDLYKYGNSKLTLAVEYCTSLKMFKKNNHYFAFDNPKMNMITSGAWELDRYPHLPEKYTTKNIQLTYFIIFSDTVYQCEVIEKGQNLFTFIHKKTSDLKGLDDDLIYTLERNPKLNYNTNIMKPINKLQNSIYWFFKNDRVFYQNNEIGDAINNYLKLCARNDNGKY